MFSRTSIWLGLTDIADAFLECRNGNDLAPFVSKYPFHVLLYRELCSIRNWESGETENYCKFGSNVAKTEIPGSLARDTVFYRFFHCLLHDRDAGQHSRFHDRRFENGHLLNGNPMKSEDRSEHVGRQFFSDRVIFLRTMM